jgi:glycosyltransferase involved in cell wall biosynthesis
VSQAGKRLSVAIVTYNHRAYIGEALDSALRQQVQGDWEIVVGDDASTDGTTELLQAYQRRHPDRIRLLLNRANRGDGGRGNYMATLAACTGDYVAYLDGDDYWLGIDKLERQASLLDQCPALSACAHPVRRLYADGSENTFAAASGRSPFSSADIGRNFTFLHCSAFMFRRAALGSLPDWFADPRIRLDDWTLALLCARQGDIGYVDTVYGVYRKHDQGIWSGEDSLRRLHWELDTRSFVLDQLPEMEERRVGSATRFHRELRAADAAIASQRGLGACYHLTRALARFPFRRALSAAYHGMFLIELWAPFSKPLLLRLRDLWRS